MHELLQPYRWDVHDVALQLEVLDGEVEEEQEEVLVSEEVVLVRVECLAAHQVDVEEVDGEVERLD